MNSYRVIGLMSGSSLDGLDIACCEFLNENGNWNYKILQTEVAAFSEEWIRKIKMLPNSTAKEISEAHSLLGNYFGECVQRFLQKNSLQNNLDLIASHGHTIFHFPEKNFTTQIGDGAAIAARTKLPVVCDFRTADIANGGQGTPIVPIGDKLLFAGYRFCLNIGGIANSSCKTEEGIIAFDICAANQILNSLANTFEKEYDANGEIAASGKVNDELLAKLNAVNFYSIAYPKSLDNSFSREIILPLLSEFQISTEDKMRTYTEHIAFQLANHMLVIAEKEKINFRSEEKILVTGGGAFNKFLMERISVHVERISFAGFRNGEPVGTTKAQLKLSIEIPNEELVKFKEAVVIAFMGVLRMRNEVNVLKSVTGAKKDSIGGALYLSV